MGVRRVFDGLYVDQLFQKNDRGEIVFYPSGLMGRGYLLPAHREAEMRTSTRRLMIFSLASGIGFVLIASRLITASAFDPMTVLLFCAGFLLLLGLVSVLQLRLAHNLAPAGERLPAREWLRRGRQARPSWTYGASVVLGLLTLLLASAGIVLGYSDGDRYAIAGGLFLLVVGALLAWDGVLGMIERSHGAVRQ